MTQNTVVCELRDACRQDIMADLLTSELKQISTRSRAMVTCYPGNDTFYTKHYDNAIGNGRKLTTILYLNAEWTAEQGGELKLYHRSRGIDDSGFTVVEPKLGRLLLFWSDKRCPHEV